MNDKFESILNDEFNDFLNPKSTQTATTLWCGNGRVENSRFRFNLDINADVLNSMVNKVLTVTVMPSKVAKFGNSHSVAVSAVPAQPLATADPNGIIAKAQINAGKFCFALTFDMIKALSWTNLNVSASPFSNSIKIEIFNNK